MHTRTRSIYNRSRSADLCECASHIMSFRVCIDRCIYRERERRKKGESINEKQDRKPCSLHYRSDFDILGCLDWLTVKEYWRERKEHEQLIRKDRDWNFSSEFLIDRTEREKIIIDGKWTLIRCKLALTVTHSRSLSACRSCTHSATRSIWWWELVKDDVHVCRHRRR